MSHWVAWPIKFLFGVIGCLPHSWQMALGDLIGVLWFDILRVRRRTVLDNLRLAFPEWSEQKRIHVGRSSCCNMGRGLFEIARLSFLRPNDEHRKLFAIEGLHHLEQAQARGKGVCLLTLHLGNGDYATAGLALHGIRMNLISKEFKFKILNDIWFELRGKLGTKFIPPRNSSYAILKALKRGEIVTFVQDQFMGPPIGVKTTFFGVETGTALGLALMASRYNSPIVPVYNYRRQDGVNAIVFEKELVFNKIEDTDELLLHITQTCNDKLQEYVTAHPEQWMWVHRRWKKFRD